MNIPKEIYEAMDSFLTEATDQNGNPRSLETLNRDRHLFVNRVVEIFNQKDRELEINIGQLRQYLNERTSEKLITSKELETFLKDN